MSVVSLVTSLHLFLLTSFGLKLLALAKIMITETFNTQYTFSKNTDMCNKGFFISLFVQIVVLYNMKIKSLFFVC